MRRTYFLIAVLFLSLALAVRTYSQQQSQEPSGMESIELGPGVSVLAPQGSKVKEHKGLVILEENSAYLSRRFSEFEERLSILEKTTQKIEEQLSQLEEGLSELKEAFSKKEKE